ncbi:MAG: hypothetical protein LUC22_04745 [Prevotella sp.]|nr:hypothetical protein [Prevotella sp.]
MKQGQGNTIKTLTRRTIWDITERDVFRLWKDAEHDADLKDSRQHYLEIIATAFEMEELSMPRLSVLRKYEARGFIIDTLKGAGGEDTKWALKKRKITRVGDITYDNIHHLTPKELLEAIDRNFGGGWDSLSENTQKIIRSYFDISTTTLPKDRLHNPGGIYDMRVAENYDVLEIPKGTWVEVIFAREKPEIVITSDDNEPETETNEPAQDEFEDTQENYENNEEDFSETFNDELKDEDVLSEESFDDDYRNGYDGEDDGEMTIDDVVAAEDRD